MAKNKELVLGFFESQAAAENAVKELQAWDKAVDGIKFDNIGVLVKDSKGKVKANMQGPRRTGVGVLLGVLAAVLTGGIGLVAGALFGGVLGHFVHKKMGMSKEDLARISKELDGGRAAVGVLVNDDEAKAVTAWIATLGGKPETHAVEEGAVEEGSKALDAEPSAEAEAPAAEAPAAEAPAAEAPAEPEAKS